MASSKISAALIAISITSCKRKWLKKSIYECLTCPLSSPPLFVYISYPIPENFIIKTNLSILYFLSNYRHTSLFKESEFTFAF